ncbi:MAG: hypothetical protein NTX59_01200 [Elusimicrobia bacterium]|nr:hypothetical protein [Elusimicrobiota bacterium]
MAPIISVFMAAMLICLAAREMDIGLSLVFSLATTGIAATCWFTAKYYLKKIPYALVSPPVVLPLFWSLFAVFMPLCYLFGGSSSPLGLQALGLNEIYVKAQFWVFIGTLMLCFGLSVFSKHCCRLSKPDLSTKGIKSLHIAWWVLLGLSSLQWIRTYQMGLFSRAAIYAPDPTPFLWITDQASEYAFYALLMISVFILSSNSAGIDKKHFLKWYRIAACFMVLYLFLKAQYRWFAIVVFLVFAGYYAYNPAKIKRYLVVFAGLALLLFPLMNTMRSAAFIVGGMGNEQIKSMLVDNLKEGLYSTYFHPQDIQRENIWDRAGITFEFTAATIYEIPGREKYFSGTLFLQDMKLMIPYMLWPEKYADGLIMDSKNLINLRARGTAGDTGMSPIIYLWAAGGPSAVLIGMFLFGLIYGYIYWKCISNMEGGLGILLYSLFPLALTQLEQHWVMNLLIPLRLCVVAVVVWWIIKVFARIPKGVHKWVAINSSQITQ